MPPQYAPPGRKIYYQETSQMISMMGQANAIAMCNLGPSCTYQYQWVP